ncbi:ATP-binding protein [Nocardioides sp.]|uniref:sensor histidine kinase n=1 Tax=Nocardioides sp. TaxID=35761 RepID=UPI003527886B
MGWHYRRSLASRVTLLATIAVGASLAFVALGAYVAVRMQMQSSFDDSLTRRAEKVVEGGELDRITGTRYEVPSWALGAADVRIIFIDTLGNSRSADRGPTLNLGPEELQVAAGTRDQMIRTVVANGTHFRVVTVPSGNGEALVLAQSQEPQLKVLRQLGLVTLLFGLAGVLASTLAGWAVARNGLRPVRRLTRSVEDSARTGELAPLAVEGDDEVARLATAFNQLLVALGAARDRERRLVADASHELRTPLTSLRTNLDLLAQADDPATAGALPEGARAELLADVRAQIEELSTLVGDLMELARDERPAMPDEQVELSEVVERALARVRRRAPASPAGALHFAVDLRPWGVEGDSGTLERAVTNLLDNAVKWSPPGGTVTVGLTPGDGLATLVVEDQGPGIAAADLPHVFERFYRADESRSMPGSGLGLAIVRQVAERHGGSVTASRADGGGARLSLELPGRSWPEAPELADAMAQTPRAAAPPSSATRRTLRPRRSGP